MKHLMIIKKYNLQAGDRIVVPKSNVRLVQHHVIYLGWVQGDYRIIENKDGIGVRIITACEFFNESSEVTRVENFTPRIGYSRTDLVEFALSLRNRKYALLGYNCESFCNHVQHGKIESRQASVGIGVAALLTLAAIAYFSD